MKAAIHEHSSNFNYLHSCRDESVEMIKTKCRYEQVEGRMVTLHCRGFFFPFRIKLCSCKISGCYFCFVLPPHSWQHLNSTKIAITSPIVLFPCPILSHCSLLHSRDFIWSRGCQTWEQGTCLLPSLSVSHKFPFGTHNCVQTLWIFKANKGKQIQVQIGRPAQSTPERLKRKEVLSF